MTGIPAVVLNHLIVELKQAREGHLRRHLLLHNPPLTSEQAAQLDFLLEQNALHPHIEDHHFNYISQFLARFDQACSSLDLTARIDSSLSQNRAYLAINAAEARAIRWYFDEDLDAIGSDRRLLVDKLEKLLCAVNSLAMDKLVENVRGAEQTVLKRLEWAASSQPVLIETVLALESERKDRAGFYEEQVAAWRQLERLVEGWLGVEAARQSEWPVGAEARRSFEAGLARMEEESGVSVVAVTEVECGLMAFEDFGQRAPLSGGVVQEYYRKLFEEVGNMKRSKQREEKESAARTVSMGWAGWFRTLTGNSWKHEY